ncbi:pancreatic progenitor cell differentiation and proliferation factor isoform X2 [Macaca mulatta]
MVGARARVSVVARCPAVSSANGLRGLASPSPPPVIVRRGPRGVAAQVPPASKPEHGGHPLQRLARGHPRLLPAPPGFHFQQQLLRQYRVPRGSHSPPPRSPQG